MRYIITLLTFFCAYTLAFSQEEMFFSSDEHLTSSLINQIYQDREGMIWVATENGLNRYDGAKFTHYKNNPQDPHSLLYNYVRCVFQDNDGHLWIGTSRGVQLYDPTNDNFSLPATLPDGSHYDTNVVNIFQRSNGDVWASGRLLRRLEVCGDRIIALPTGTNLPDQYTDYVIEDCMKNIWMIKEGGRFLRLSPSGDITSFNDFAQTATGITLCTDYNGNVYVGTIGKGVLCFDLQTDTFRPIPYQGYKHLPIQSLYLTADNRLLVGTDGYGLKTYVPDRKEMEDLPFDSRYFNSRTSKVHSCLYDNAGNLWLAIYQKGVIMIPARKTEFHYIGYQTTDRNLVGSNSITPFAPAEDGQLWVGTDSDGLYLLNAERNKSRHFAHNLNTQFSAPSTPLCIYRDSYGTTWVGSYSEGLFTVDVSAGRFTPRTDFVTEEGIHIPHVYNIIEDGFNRLWIATMGNGVLYLDRRTGRWEHCRTINKQINRWVNCLFYDTYSQFLYVGTYYGAYAIDLRPGKQMEVKTLLTERVVYAFEQTDSEALWIATSTGVIRINPRNPIKLRVYDTKQGLPSDMVYALENDHANNLWVSTDNGLCRLKPDGSTDCFYRSDGLQGNEFSKNASMTDADGCIWLGGTQGITYFQPERITPQIRKATVRLVGCYANGEPLRTGKPIWQEQLFHLRHDQHNFSLELATEEFHVPAHTTYL